jgi:predicted GIY-YIG superfamily endonuclease
MEVGAEEEVVAARRYCCYILLSENGRRSYAGCTNNLARRLRQHNGDLVGGAKATHNGRPWTVLRVVEGFDGQRSALRFEWRLKQHRGWYRSLRGTAQVRRLRLLEAALRWAGIHLPTLELTEREP